MKVEYWAVDDVTNYTLSMGSIDVPTSYSTSEVEQLIKLEISERVEERLYDSSSYRVPNVWNDIDWGFKIIKGKGDIYD